MKIHRRSILALSTLFWVACGQPSGTDTSGVTSAGTSPTGSSESSSDDPTPQTTDDPTVGSTTEMTSEGQTDSSVGTTDNPATTTDDPTTTTDNPSTDGTSDTATEGCDDPCPVSGGIVWQCKQRFLYGVNYAWHHFGADFGGIQAWGQPGVSGHPDEILAELQDMRAHGARVIRWWIWPDFRSDAVMVDNGGYVTGIGGTALADFQKALELADQADVYLMPCLFSFDAFRPGQDMGGQWVPGITGMVTDADKQVTLLEQAVRPLLQAASQSPYHHRIFAWDVINEPEWAMWDQNPYGDPPYDPIGDLQPVSHAQMESFLAATIAEIRNHSDAPVTVGAAAFKWSQAWRELDLDFDQFHMYDWVDQYWPYEQPPTTYGLDQRPVMMGEFYFSGVGGDDYTTVVETWLQAGYAGALGWQYNEASAEQLDAVQAFAEQHACEVEL